MRIIVAGGRNFNNRELLFKKCDLILKDTKEPIEIVSGEAKGADKLGEEYAMTRGYKVAKFPADWDTHGKAAGVIRNSQMANYADALIAFWDGKSRGTKHMIETASSRGLKVRVIKY